MRIISHIFVNFKRYITNPLLIGMTFIFPILIILGTNFTSKEGETGQVGIIDNDQSEYSQELSNKISESYDVIKLEGTAEANYGKLIDDDINTIYVIDNNFSKDIEAGTVPKLSSYNKGDTEGTMVLDNMVNNIISEMLKENIVGGISKNSITTEIHHEEVEKDDNSIHSLLMIFFYMFMGNTGAAVDILLLKKSKVLRRDISTPNRDIEIFGGIFGALLIIQWILSTLAYLVIRTALGMSYGNLGIIIWTLFLCSLVSTAVVIFVTRWIKNQVLGMLAISMISMISFLLALVGMQLDSFTGVPQLLTTLSIISPFQWMLKIVADRQIIIPSIILVLMSLVFFTAGSFKLRDYVKE